MEIKNKKLLTILTISSLMTGCAGSAAHKVVTANQAGDQKLTCEHLDQEIIKVQVIIDNVNKDKDDISGADVVDGILWFPFNLVAKHANYNDALEAADRRIAKLNELKERNGCQDNENEIKMRSASLTEHLRELHELYKDGILTEAEYNEAKLKALDEMKRL